MPSQWMPRWIRTREATRLLPCFRRVSKAELAIALVGLAGERRASDELARVRVRLREVVRAKLAKAERG